MVMDPRVAALVWGVPSTPQAAEAIAATVPITTPLVGASDYQKWLYYQQTGVVYPTLRPSTTGPTMPAITSAENPIMTILKSQFDEGESMSLADVLRLILVLFILMMMSRAGG